MDCGLMYLAYQCFHIEQTLGDFVSVRVAYNAPSRRKHVGIRS
jgi:hypothetical protein